jgi:hypothetical protein
MRENCTSGLAGGEAETNSIGLPYPDQIMATPDWLVFELPPLFADENFI